MARARSPLEQLIRTRVEQHPDEVWLKFGDDTWTWSRALSCIQRAANGLADLGVKPGERVAIMMSNRPEYLWVHYGIGLVGGISVPVNTSQRGPTLEYILADSGSVAAVFEEEFRDVVLTVAGRMPALRATVVAEGRATAGVDWTLERLLDHADGEPDVDVEQGTTGLTMMYTSGTTGPPKGVLPLPRPEGAQAPRAGNAFQAAGIQPGETIYTCLPLFHGNALGISTVGSIVSDLRLALAKRFSASRLWDDCRRYEAVEFNSLGAMIPILLKQPARPDDADNPVRLVLSAACPAWAWREFETRFGVRILEGYGMVDAPGGMSNAEGKVGSMGRPTGEVEFRVVDGNDNPLPAGKIGELVFRNPLGQLTHYHNQPEATADAYRGGWFHSGDLAEYDEEGFYYFRGRKKASIRRRGENISPWEIETVLNQHDAILESAAYAVPSELGEDEVAVAVVLQPGASLTHEQVVRHCEGNMAYYAIPRYVEIVDEIPKTGTHRVQYGILRERGITESTWDREKAGVQVARRTQSARRNGDA